MGFNLLNIQSALAISTSINITGKVTDDSGAAIQDAQVSAYFWNVDYWEQQTETSTDASGNYSLDGLASNSYKVKFGDVAGNYITEYYDNATTLDNAANVVTAGNTVSDIDAQLATAGHITGTVTNSAGTAIQDIWVSAYAWDGNSWNWVTEVNTDISGNYNIGGLASSDYRLRFNDWSGNYLSEYNNDAATLDTAIDITVTAGDTNGNIDAQLATAGHITGMVTDSNNAVIQNIGVSAYAWDGNSWNWVTEVNTDASGNYSIGGLDSDNYRIRFDTWNNSGYVAEYYDDAVTIDAAQDIAVTAGSTTNSINAQLATAGFISGTVTDSNGTAIQDIQVSAYTQDGNDWSFINSGYTDASGNYNIGGLASGDYRLRFDDSSGNYLSEYNNDAATLDTAIDITVTTGNTTENINA
ncbi:carboxypeptidase-like regulatory domain-containing protein, partial [Candidatus Venteria ishoeyi]|uniref:carboxypeptidase-like regulatory domain-containing protein n=1 Tax=Candidatus Venteria ishoeyi TaxID=1899563 RepID=UPI0015AB9AD6